MGSDLGSAAIKTQILGGKKACSLRGVFALLAIVCANLGSQSASAGGVTVITHGFASNVNDWIIPMAGKVGGHPAFPGETYSCYQISITRNGAGQ